GCGSALSMEFWKDRLYLVTTAGTLACLDASEPAIRAAEAGPLPQARANHGPEAAGGAPGPGAGNPPVGGGGAGGGGRAQGGPRRVRPVGRGYHKDWYVQFPKDIREAGARYVVPELRESARGGFYRAYGEIKKLV